MKKALIALAILSTTVAISQVVAPPVQKVKIELSVEETQLVLDALQAKPYSQVAGLIQNIITQANAQIKPDSAQGKGKVQKN